MVKNPCVMDLNKEFELLQMEEEEETFGNYYARVPSSRMSSILIEVEESIVGNLN